MSWFKVDDGFYDHPKLDKVPNAAVGLWVKAGSWCSKHETDGVIPASRVKALKGTASQISALIRCGLWVETESESGAKAYSFRDWFDYQPSRKERQEERAMWREKKRESRRQKLDNLRKGEYVPGGVPEMSPEGTNGGVPEMSGTIPVPSRPVPTHIGGTGSQPSYGGTAREAGGGAEEHDPLDALAAAAQRARDAGISERAITAGAREFDRRPHPKGPGLLRTLIDDAWRDEQTAARALATIDARRSARDECERCNDQGFIETTIDGHPAVIRCNHQPPADLDPDDDTPPWEKHS